MSSDCDYCGLKLRKKRQAFIQKHNTICNEDEALPETIKKLFRTLPVPEKINYEVKIFGEQMNYNFINKINKEELKEIISFYNKNLEYFLLPSNFCYLQEVTKEVDKFVIEPIVVDLLKEEMNKLFNNGNPYKYGKNKQNLYKAAVKKAATILQQADIKSLPFENTIAGNYTTCWRNLLDSQRELEERLTKQQKNKVKGLTWSYGLEESVGILKFDDDHDFGNLTLADVLVWLKDVEEVFNRFHYRNNFQTLEVEKVTPKTFADWLPGMGMLDFKFKIADAPAVLKNYGKKLIKNLTKEVMLEHVFILLKTSTYWTQWHLDVTDLPAFAVLKQVIGQTVLLGSYGVLPLIYYSEDPMSQFLGSTDDSPKWFKDQLKDFFKMGNQRLRKQYKRMIVLNPGDCAIVPLDTMHQAHVPDANNLIKGEFSVLAVYMLQLKKSPKTIAKYNMYFESIESHYKITQSSNKRKRS